MNPAPRFSSSSKALAAVVAPRSIGSPMSAKARKVVRVIMVLLGLFVLVTVAIGVLGKKTERRFQEESQTLDPYGNRNYPWGRR